MESGVFVKKSLDVLAFKFGGISEIHLREWPDWAQQAFKNGDICSVPGWPACHVKTVNGFVTVQLGEWIIQGVEGELYPCKDEVFKKTYDKTG